MTLNWAWTPVAATSSAAPRASGSPAEAKDRPRKEAGRVMAALLCRIGPVAESNPAGGRVQRRQGQPAALGHTASQLGGPGNASNQLESPLAATARSAASTVFESSIAIVIGPTPPGTGVIAPATCGDAGEVDVAAQLAVGVAVHADVDDDRARLDHVGGQRVRRGRPRRRRRRPGGCARRDRACGCGRR